MDHRVAASVVALRPIIEDFIMRYTSEPERAVQMTESDLSLKRVIQELSKQASIAQRYIDHYPTICRFER